MLKKISVASAILLLVCILVSIALLPFAIDDFGKMVSQYETAHSGYTLFYEKDTEGISSLYLSDYYEDLEIVESPDGVIRAYARESIPYSVSYAEMLEPDGQLTLERRYNGLSGNNFSREYMVDRVLASMSNSSYSFRLEVPKDLPVKVTNYYRLTNPQELDVSLYQPEPEELPQPEESRPERLTNQQALSLIHICPEVLLLALFFLAGPNTRSHSKRSNSTKPMKKLVYLARYIQTAKTAIMVLNWVKKVWKGLSKVTKKGINRRLGVS